MVSSLKATGANLDSGHVNDTNMVLDHDTFYGNARNTQMWNIQYNSGGALLSYGAAPDTSCNDGGSCHGDCMHIWGEDSATITNNIFLYCDVQAYFLELQNGGSWEGTNNINNNYWVMMDEGSGAGPDCTANCGNWGGRNNHGIWTATAGSPNVGTNTATVNVLGNTFTYGIGTDFGSANSPSAPYGHETINYKGNLGGLIANDSPYSGCGSNPQLTISYDYNIFADDGNGLFNCGTHVSDYSWASTISTWVDPLTGALSSNALPPGSYVNDAGTCAALGRSTPCNAGVVGTIGAG
jgi:hypothetical protein